MWKELQKRFQSTESVVSLILGLAVVLVMGAIVVNYLRGKQQVGLEKREREAKQEQPVSLPATHVIAEGETLWSIAEKYYKSGYNWVDIQKANTISDPDRIEAGQTLTIPTATPIVPAEGQVSSASMETKPATTYIVVRGDTLWAISLAQYGTGYRWVDIARENNLANPDLIHAGNVFTLPK